MTQKQIETAQKLYDKVRQQLKLKTKLNRQDQIIKTLELEKLIPIVGEYGSGKSSLCNHLLNYFCSDEFLGPIPIFVPLGELSKNENSDLQEEIFDYVCSEYKFNLDKFEFFEKIEAGDFLFILDALDEMSFKLDSLTGQKNLERVVKLAKKSIVLLTSRHTYLSNAMKIGRAHV